MLSRARCSCPKTKLDVVLYLTVKERERGREKDGERKRERETILGKKIKMLVTPTSFLAKTYAQCSLALKWPLLFLSNETPVFPVKPRINDPDI